jgi:putative resolvase
VDGPPRPGRTVLYARVSSTDQREDLGRQGAADWGLQTREVVTEVGSGPNGRHPQVDPAAPGLPRGARLLEAALLSSGRRIGVIDPEEVADDLVQGMYEVLTSLCARL